MKNHNVYEVSGDIETKIKNGDIRQIIIFQGIPNPLSKILSLFPERKEIGQTDTFPYTQQLIKFRSPFRIGEQQLRLIEVEDIISKTAFNEKNFITLIQNICKKFKNSITLLPLSGPLNQYNKDINKLLEENVHDTKIVVLN